MTIRWISTFQMLESALLYQQAYIKYKLVDTDFKYALSEEEWKRVETVAKCLKSFYDITILFSGNKYPTANLYLPNVWKIQMLLEEERNSSDLVMNEMTTLILRKFKKYWRSYSKILSLAIVLDPQYKMKFVKFCFSKIDPATADAKVKIVEDHLQLLFKEYLVSSTSISLMEEHAYGRCTNEARDEFEEFDVFENQESGRGKTQLDLYMEEPNLDRKANPDLDVLTFWMENRLRFSELSLMARDVLSIPITTVASESTFSIGGRIIGKFQSSILPANAEAKLCTRDWLCEQEDCSKSDTDEDEIAVDLQPYLDKLSLH
ncbi:zinc finger BED domain-containing protein RICESLEEPER 3-like isoform X1 [Nicotiana tabacum]|uniref:Zinc finger BED domain-containing protein RICESLEEPER 3-like isoform X1 n=3 Tax=Nicotiana tabacum TaxID=4097 RepID=A0A1S4CCN9_TOBAC|nr:PREDICTED: zinc finger BED domain-containing protein RICESLEEPER 3-like isoform X1 [Nicotiana tabacum]XP_016498972.1 PREDICTED: zinc finger BED domain-containing protein RICESLEEPER 3-like isoform X1 [Nicotiana tabacum]XP_016498973.1 PREDICTED: zinc finger BED domain-containing protein RICESLEEPER 3-like isoform X1 [Nicotiana tabacum]